MADRLGVAPESADAAEDDRARRTRAREKARAQSSGALREEARRDPPNPARLTCGERIGPYTGKTRAGVASFRAVGHDMATAPFDAKEEHQAIGNVLSGGAELEGCVHSRSPRGVRPRHRAPRQPPARKMRKMKRSAASFPPFRERTRGGASAPNARHLGAGNRAGRPAPARNTRRRARAAPSPPGTASPRQSTFSARWVGRQPTRLVHADTCVRGVLFSISPGSRRVRRVRHFFRLFFPPTAFFFCFSADSRARRATSPETDLFSSHARLSPQRGRERRRLLDARARAASVRGRG